MFFWAVVFPYIVNSSFGNFDWGLVFLVILPREGFFFLFCLILLVVVAMFSFCVGDGCDGADVVLFSSFRGD